MAPVAPLGYAYDANHYDVCVVSYYGETCSVFIFSLTNEMCSSSMQHRGLSLAGSFQFLILLSFKVPQTMHEIRFLPGQGWWVWPGCGGKR